MAHQLNMGDLFPKYTVKTADGQTVTLPDDLRGEYSVLLFYRGVW
jgi:peroxiredoxin